LDERLVPPAGELPAGRESPALASGVAGQLHQINHLVQYRARMLRVVLEDEGGREVGQDHRLVLLLARTQVPHGVLECCLGAKLLSVLLFAAAGTGRSMADVARWVDVQDVDDVAQALMEIGNQQALDAWAACTSRPDNTMGSVYGTAETLLDVFGDPQIVASAEGCDLDLDELLSGANNTLYLYAPASEQERLRPLFELLVSVVI
jgi:hypothetical protein